MGIARRCIGLAGFLALLCLSGCGWTVAAGTPGHEPPTAGTYNPVSHENNQD